MHFARANLEPALILAGRNNAKDARYARGIRFVLGSYTNHNALIIPDSVAGGFCVGDTTAPRSSIVPLEAYERLMNEEGYVVRIWRVRGLTDQERASVAYMWRTRCNNLPYADHTVR